jgi:hypothetical protein
MELNHDWNSFNSVFYAKRKGLSRQGGETSSPIYFVVEEEKSEKPAKAHDHHFGDHSKILAAFSGSEDLREILGKTLADAFERYPHRRRIVFGDQEVSQWVDQSVQLPHFHDQMVFFRKQAKSPKRMVADDHFLLEALQGWWAKILPSSYGFFIRIEGQAPRDLLVVVRRGRIDSFYTPDLSSMGADRMRKPEEVVRHLAERNALPIQGLFVQASEWQSWGESTSPWRKIATAVRESRARLFPFRWSLVGLVSTRAFFGL